MSSASGGLSAAILCLLSFCSLSAAAQEPANLSGRVTDPAGAAVPAASVTANDLDTGISRTALTNQEGQYELFALPVGRYEVRARKDGFAEKVRTGILLVVGQDATADLSLQVGEVNQQMTVVANVPMVNTTTQDISGLVGEKEVKELPLNGRSYDLLLTLNPGIVNFTSQKTGGIGVSNSRTGNNFAVSGNRPQQNMFLLNGVEFTGAAENNMQPGGPSQQLMGVEAVREFNVLRDSYGAEYGKRPGAQVIDYYPVWEQSMARIRLRVFAQQHPRCAELLRSWDRRRLFGATSSEGRLGGTDQERQDIYLRELRRISPAPAPDLRSVRARSDLAGGRGAEREAAAESLADTDRERS